MTDEIEQSSKNTDDYSLVPVPKEARTNWGATFNALIGFATALFFMQMGSIMALNYGVGNALLSLLYATVVGGIFGYAIGYIAAKTGLGTNLIARSAGFGSIGVVLLSIVYGFTEIMYFAIEGNIMAASVKTFFPAIPLWLLMLVVGLGMIPLVWYGMKLIEKFQKYTVVIYLILLAPAIGISIYEFSNNSSNWALYMPESMPLGGSGLLAGIGMMNGVLAILALNIGDYARFIKHDQIKKGVFFVGVVTQVCWFLIAGLLGIWFGINYSEGNPGVYFVGMLGIWGTLFAIVTQLRINVGNLYIGSVAISNFFSQLFRFAPGRSFWVVVAATIATLSMIMGLADHMGFLITLSGVYLMAFLSTILADIFIVRKLLKLGPAELEYRSEYLREWNPIGVFSAIVSSILGTLMILGVLGSSLESVSAITTGILNVIFYVSLSMITKGRYNYPKNVNIAQDGMKENTI